MWHSYQRRNRSSCQPKSCRPISLTSFLQRITIYQTDKTTTTATHSLINTIEKALLAKEVAMCSFIDIEGNFDNTTYQAIKRAGERMTFNPATLRWTETLLSTEGSQQK